MKPQQSWVFWWVRSHSFQPHVSKVWEIWLKVFLIPPSQPPLASEPPLDVNSFAGVFLILWRHQVQNHTTINRLSAGSCLLISSSTHSELILVFYTHYRHKSGRWGAILIPTVMRKHHKALSMAHTIEIYESSCPCPVMEKKKKCFRLPLVCQGIFRYFFSYLLESDLRIWGKGKQHCLSRSG